MPRDNVYHDRLEIWSGGQTGVDRAALDAAMTLGIPYGGWVPGGRLAEDGPLPERYTGMRETESARPDVRTRRNVRESDATLIVVFGPVTGGTALALETAELHHKPVKVVDLSAVSVDVAVGDARAWLASLERPVRLNVAGPRESTTSGAYRGALAFLIALLREPSGAR